MSVVTPCYNGRPFIERALRSVEQVGRSVRLEHVVADGRSTDGTLELLVAAPLVRGISRSDDGLYSALNWAINQARGEYIQWLNVDDELPPGFIEEAVAILDSDPGLDLIVGDTLIVDAQGREKERWSYDLSRALDFRCQARGYFFNINSALFRRSLVRRAGPFDGQAFPIGADRDFELRLVGLRPRGIAVDRVAYRFREHEGSLSSALAARAGVQLETARLCEAWSDAAELPASIRREFAVSSKELFIGVGLKWLRSRATARSGLALLARHLARRPHLVPAAASAWFRNRYGDPGPPMRVTMPGAVDENQARSTP